MAIANIKMDNSCLSVDRYQVGNTRVVNKTKYQIKVIFHEQFTKIYNKDAHLILIANKYIIKPACADPSRKPIAVFDCQKISFKSVNEFIRIKMMTSDGSNHFLFVDSKKYIKDKAYFTYSYIPSEISLEMAFEKIQNIETDFPNFKPLYALYNRHGVAVHGYDENEKKHCLCWANPSDTKAAKLDITTSDPRSDLITAETLDKELRFEYTPVSKTDFRLNSEIATPINLTNKK